MNPPWQYDEFRHVGTDFSDRKEVKAYDGKQGTSVEGETELVKSLGIAPEDTVIEFGCGTGAFSVAAARRCKQVYAVDISKAMLEHTASRAADLGIGNIETRHAGFLTYEHTGDPANWMVTKFAFHHLPDAWKAVALDRMRRMMAPDGRLYLRDVVFSFPADEMAEHIERWIDAYEGGFSREAFETHVRDEYSTFTVALEALLRNAGFDIEKAEYPEPVYAAYVCRVR